MRKPSKDEKLKSYTEFKRTHSFYWQTKLTNADRNKINALLSSLSEEDYRLIEKLLDDVRDEVAWDTQAECEY